MLSADTASTLRPRDLTVVLVPGLGLTERSYRGVRAELSGDHRVVALPALGLRARPWTDLGVTRQAQRLLTELTRQQVGAAVLVGHSASCPVVVEAAVQSPVPVGLVLVGPVTDPRARSWPRVVLQWLCTATHERPWEAAVLLPQFLRCGPLTMLRSLHTLRLYPTESALARVDAPTVVVRGSADRITPHDWAEALAAPGGEPVHTAYGSAHMVPLTDPAAVGRAVERVRAQLLVAPSSSTGQTHA